MRMMATRTIEEPTSLPALLPPEGGYLWMHEGQGMAGWGDAARIDAGTGEERFSRSHRAVMAEFERLGVDGSDRDGPVVFGSFTFDADEPGSSLVIPSTLVGVRGSRAWCTTLGAPPVMDLPRRTSDAHHDFKIRYAGSTISEVEWLDAVARAVKSVESGDLSKVVLARDILIWSKEAFDLPVLLERLAARFPECYTFACDGLVGASPELLVRRRGRRVSSLVLAGSAPRGVGAEDAELGSAL
ncbi:MAG: chorismate-binding protein, partial [Actinomycetota bacterium]